MHCYTLPFGISPLKFYYLYISKCYFHSYITRSIYWWFIWLITYSPLTNSNISLFLWHNKFLWINLYFINPFLEFSPNYLISTQYFQICKIYYSTKIWYKIHKFFMADQSCHNYLKLFKAGNTVLKANN